MDHHKSRVWNRMQKEKGEKEWVCIGFARKDVPKISREKYFFELEWKGNHYDVVQSVRKGDSVFYWCYPDEKENILVRCQKKIIEFIVDKKPEGENKESQNRPDFCKTLFWPNHLSLVHPPNPLEKNFEYRRIPGYVFGVLSPPQPPPEC